MHSFVWALQNYHSLDLLGTYVRPASRLNNRRSIMMQTLEASSQLERRDLKKDMLSAQVSVIVFNFEPLRLPRHIRYALPCQSPLN